MKQNIITFQKLLKELQGIDPEFPIQYAICLAEISLREGLSITTLSERTGLTLSTVSRIVGALSDDRKKGKHYDLIHIKTSPHSKRTKEIHLTAKGHKALRNIAKIMTD